MKKNDIVMGDKIIVNNSAIGAIGNGAVNYGNVTNTPVGYDFKAILQELGQLKTTISRQAESDEQGIALARITLAEEAALQEDGRNMVSHLKKLGVWVGNVARDIGVNVIASIITQ